MDDYEKLDVKDFPLFDSTDVDYHTFDIITEETTDCENKGKETRFEDYKNIIPVKTKVEETFDANTAFVTVKLEPEDYSTNGNVKSDVQVMCSTSTKDCQTNSGK